MGNVIKKTYHNARHFAAFCFLAIFLTGCMGIEFGEETPTSNTTSEQNKTSNAATDNTATSGVSAQNISGDTVQLEPYFSFFLKNESSTSLSGVSVKLLAGTAQTQFAHINAILANRSPVVVNVPSFIVDNTVYVVIESGSGTTIERHQIRDNNITVVRR